MEYDRKLNILKSNIHEYYSGFGSEENQSREFNSKDQFDSSLTNLFDSLNRPLVHENKFDLTQKINDNFKDILGECESRKNMQSNEY